MRQALIRKVEYSPLLEKTRNSLARTVVHIGGTNSSKSYSMAQYCISQLLEGGGVRIGICQKTFPALRRSTMLVVLNLLKNYGIYEPRCHNKTFHTYERDDGAIEFFGLDDPQKLKGAGFNIIWMEEATDFTHEDYTLLKLQLPKKPPIGERPNQIFLSLNPVDANSWIAEKLSQEPDVEIIHSTHLDNPFLDAESRKIIEDLKGIDENYYRVYALGEWGRLENLIFKNFRVVTEIPVERQAMAYGLDFGWSSPTALVKVTICNREMFLEERIYRQRLTNADLIELLSHEEKGDIYADPAEPQRIEEIWRAGYGVYPANKDVKMGIDLCKRQTLNLLDESVHGVKEIKGYQYKKDKNGTVLDEPVKYHDHFLDGMRYAIMGLVERYGFATASPGGFKVRSFSFY